ncbi:DUF624 domain-containing protein [Bifidobacterium sp. ESL0822]|uniref:DUF624 domain-containing protein n=1 Tax=Bifidobacterium sp. ESL0822 TaxID=3448585 RepID=UPI0040430B28
MHILSPESAFMRGLSTVIDAVWITILMIVASLPAITAGSALVAANYAARRSLAGIGHVTQDFFAAFKSNFKQATILWLILGIPGAALIVLWIVVRSWALLAPQLIATCFWVISFEWVWWLQARFANSVVGTLKNSLIFGLTKWPYTLVIVMLDCLIFGLLFASVAVMPRGLFLLALVAPGGLVMVKSAILNHAMRSYVA